MYKAYKFRLYPNDKQKELEVVESQETLENSTEGLNQTLAEQTKIAEILMQCDKVIELKQKRIEEEKKLKFDDNYIF